MKVIVLAFLFLLPIYSQAQSPPNTDSALKNLSLQVTALSNKVDTLAKQIKDSLRISSATSANCKTCPNPTLSLGEVLLIVSPILLFVITLFLVRNRLKKDGFRLSDALSTFRSKTIRTVNRTFNVDGNQTSHIEQENTTDEPVRSTSRVIAFLTAVVALIIAIVITSYIGYQTVSGCCQQISLDGLWKILLALGIGVIPYGANVLNGNSKEDPAKPVTG